LAIEQLNSIEASESPGDSDSGRKARTEQEEKAAG
jgi:NADH dehydrogenase